MCMYVSEICAEGIFVTFPWWLKNVKSRSKITPFSNERHFEIWFPKREQLRFSEENYLNYTKKTQFCMWQLHFPSKTRGNKNKPWTHSTPLKVVQCPFKCDISDSVRLPDTPPGNRAWYFFSFFFFFFFLP